MLTKIGTRLVIGSAMLTGFAPGLAGAASYQYTTLSVTLNPPGNVNVTGLDARGDVDGYVSDGISKKPMEYAFAYVNGSVELATPIGGKFFSQAAGISSNGIAIVYKNVVGKKHQTALKWDVVANKLSPLYSSKPMQGFNAQYINSSGDLVGHCNAGACFVSGGTSNVMTKNATEGVAGPFGLSDAGFSGGFYIASGSNVYTLFTYVNGTETDYNMPAVNLSPDGAVSSNNVLAGSYKNAQGTYYGFTLADGTFTSYNYPGATNTFLTSVNASGQVIGTYATASGNFSFLYQNGSYLPLSVPGAVSTYLTSINDNGTIAGSYTPKHSKYAVGFVATCASGPGTCTP